MTHRVAVAGAGFFARFHLEAWQRMPDVDLVGLADRAPRARAPWTVPGFDDVAAMLEATSPDILDIALPPDLHLDTIRLAVDHGVRHIICQKPFCGGLVGAREAVALAKSSGTRIIVHENFRFQPWYRVARDVIAKGQLGTVHQMVFRLRPGDGQGPDAYLDRQPYFQQMERFLIHETGVHLLDVFVSLFGPVEHVYADLRQLNPAIRGEDAGYVLLDHVNGVRSLFDGNRHLDHDAGNCRLTMGEAAIEGTEATLTLTGNGALVMRRHGTQEAVPVLPAQAWPGFGGDCVHAFQRHAVTAIALQESAETEAVAYLSILHLQESVYRSAAEGRKLTI